MELDIITRLRSKIEELISRYESLYSENEKLRRKVEDLSSQVDIKNNRINTLEKQINKIQLTEALKGASGDNAAAKKKVASLIGEIDRCIALLNN